jgi:hypothetical protein
MEELTVRGPQQTRVFRPCVCDNRDSNVVKEEEGGSFVDGSGDDANKQRAVVAPSGSKSLPLLPFLMCWKITLETHSQRDPSTCLE